MPAPTSRRASWRCTAALRDYPTNSTTEYGKVQSSTPLPKSFDPPVDPEGHRNVAEEKKIEWQDYDADGNLKPPDRPND